MIAWEALLIPVQVAPEDDTLPAPRIYFIWHGLGDDVKTTFIKVMLNLMTIFDV